ncbi:MAG: TVP38/TMEM64 family protein [Clostridium sp.]|uniref:TVP38/TMEM64 family protein n=1 Tax=Clostridium sp. LY3-2 TaxID=2942482 RepID=UPI002152D3EF|nr:TVP38/TMEM64 family protein [Clostridium sp. LY3-2]MCR6514591.1 TVP38/TMEM64 family protein [Clostridium sp. LY3-2]
MKKKTLILGIIIIFLILFGFYIYQNNINIMEVLTVNNIKDFVLSFGIFGPIIAILICILTCITTFIPGFLVVFALSALYGFIGSVIITMIGYTLGSIVCFILAKYLGRDFVLKYTTKGAMKKLDDFLKTEGFMSILISRLLPFIPYNLTSYLAGLSSIDLKSFILGTVIGQIPGTLAYAYIGKLLTGTSKSIFLGISIFLALISLTILLKKRYYK